MPVIILKFIKNNAKNKQFLMYNFKKHQRMTFCEVNLGNITKIRLTVSEIQLFLCTQKSAVNRILA